MFRTRLAAVSIAILSASTTACHPSATELPPLPSTASVDGSWTGATSSYTTLQIQLAERTSDHVLSGTWTGRRAQCAIACVDSGIVFRGSRSGSALDFAVTAINGTRSLAITATFDGTRLVGTSTLTDNGAHFPAEPIVLQRP